MGGIFDDPQIVGAAEAPEPIDIDRAPAKCTGSSARVRGVRAASTWLGSRFMVCLSTSAKTGVAPACTIVFTVAQNVRGVVTTSSPGPTPHARSDRWSPAVHEFIATA